MSNIIVIPELLLDCLGRKNADDPVDRLCRLTKDEWEELVMQSKLHRVTPLLYLFLKSNIPDKIIPPEIIQRLQKNYLASAAANTIIFHEVPQIAEALRNIGVTYAFLKGVHLAEVIYGDIALRPMADVDILLGKDDIKRTEAALNSIGYFAARPFSERDFDDYHHMLPLTNSLGVTVEVHWCLIKPENLFNISTGEVLNRAEPVIIDGAEVYVLSAEDLLLHLCIHAAYQHCFDLGLIQLCDIEKTIHRYKKEIDWEKFANSAREWGVERCVFLTFKLAKQLFSAEVPEVVLNRLQPGIFDEKLFQNAFEQILMFVEEDINLSPRMAKVMQSESIGEKAAAITKSFFPPRNVMSRMYPVSSDSLKIYLYYPVRFKDLLVRYGSGFLKVLRKDRDAEEWSKHRMKAEELRDWMIEGEELKPKRF